MAKILIVDDDRSLTHLTKIVLEDEGYEVAVANSVSQAMEEIEKNKPDLILMDVVMPETSGADAVRTLQKNPQLKHIPIIFVTGLVPSNEGDLVKKIINIHGKAYPTVGKPVNISDLLKIIKDSLAG